MLEPSGYHCQDHMGTLLSLLMDNHTGIQYKLRLPSDLKERIAESAKTHNRSMNADMVARLQESFDGVLTKPKKRSIMLGNYNPVDAKSRPEMIEMSWKWIKDYFDRYPDYELINVETQQHGVIFWYSYTVDEKLK
jgi:hypothetical protein